MAKTTLTPRLLADFVAASPEGFFNQSELNRYTSGPEATAQLLTEAVAGGFVGQEGEYVFDSTRLTAEQVRERSALFAGAFPQTKSDGTPYTRSIVERMKARDHKLNQLRDPVLVRLIDSFESTPGYLPRAELCTQPGDDVALATLLAMGLLKISDDMLFDPLRITRGSLKDMRHKQVVAPVRQQLTELLEAKPGQTAPRIDLVEK